MTLKSFGDISLCWCRRKLRFHFLAIDFDGAGDERLLQYGFAKLKYFGIG
jgi:hypothetical protein